MKKKLALVIVLVLVLVASFTFIVRGRDQGEAPATISNTEDTEPVKLAYVPEPTPETTPVLTPEPMPENTPEPTPEPTTEPIEWFEEVEEEVKVINKTLGYITFNPETLEITDSQYSLKPDTKLTRTGIGTKEVAQWSRCLLPDGETIYILTIDLTPVTPVYTGGGTGNGGNGAGGNTTPPVQQQPQATAQQQPSTTSTSTDGPRRDRTENSTAPVIVDPSNYESIAGKLH